MRKKRVAVEAGGARAGNFLPTEPEMRGVLAKLVSVPIPPPM